MEGNAERWWMVGCDGSLPHFYRAPTGRSAVAKFRANLINMERGGAGVSLRDARIIVRGLQPHVIDGPLTAREAFEADLGWALATAVCDDNHALMLEPTGPITRDAAVQRLGEERVARMEQSARKRYGLES